MSGPGGVAVVTDSTADIPVEMAQELGVTVVPLNVSIGEEAFPDGVLTQKEFFDKMAAAPALPTTSQPSVGAFLDVYEDALSRKAEVVSVHISSKLSGTLQSATEAARRFAGRVHVVDSLNLSWGLAFQVRAAAKKASEGASASDVISATERIRDRVELIVGVDKLDNLAKGGRIGKVAAFLGGMLNLRVTFHVGRDGTFVPLARVRGAQAALRETVEWVSGRLGPDRRGAFCVLHAMAEDKAEWLREQLHERFDVAEYFEMETGSVISAHTGTGWGVAFVPLD